MKALTITNAELDNLAEILNIDRDDIRPNYSGRGMYGKTCLGIVLSDVQPVRLGVALVEALTINVDIDETYDEVIERASRIAARAQTDSMGLSTIVYFSHVTVTD